MRNLRGAMAAKRCLSTVSPKISIAQNILLLDQISAAKDVSALEKIASSPKAAIDVNNLPQRLEDLSPWFALDSTSTAVKFVPDPTAWQNMPFWDYVQVESGRAETWPFIVGFA